MKYLLSILLLFFSLQIYSQEIFEAYEKGDYDKVEALLKNGIDPNQFKTSNGMTLMFDAAWDNNLAIVKLLHQYGADVDLLSGNHNVPPLLAACQQNSYESVVFLVENGADVNRKIEVAGNQTPIRFACKTGNVGMVSYLLENGADLEDKPNDLITPIIQASRSDHLELVKFLIEQGADVNAYGRDKECALNQAIKNNNEEIVELLINSGAKLSYVDEKGYSSLKLAKKSKNQRIIQLIKENL